MTKAQMVEKYGIERYELHLQKSREHKTKTRVRNPRFVPPEIRFWTFVEKLPGENACWEWTGAILEKGYGSFFVSNGNKDKRAHRFSYKMNVGPINGLNVCHSCDNRRCVRPSHLFLGTQKENVADCFAKRRANRLSGEKHYLTTLTDDHIREIRGSSILQRDLALQYGVSQQTISKIKRRVQWKHVEDS